MTLAQVEKRLMKLEQVVEKLGRIPSSSAEAWLESAGQFGNDRVFEEIIRLGRVYRKSLRPAGKRAGNGRLRH